MVRSKESPAIFYGWIIAAACSLILASSFGVQASFSVFYVAILEDFGWSRADTAIIFSISLFVYGLMSLVAGSLIDRFGPRRVLPVGALILALGIVACSQANAIWQFILFYGGVAALGMALVGYVANSAILANWFVRKRGTAFGILTAGFGIGGILTLLVQWLISTMGWRKAFLVLSIIPPIVVVPLSVLLMRHRPQDIGLLPDGDTKAAHNRTGAGQESPFLMSEERIKNEWTVPRVLRNYRFWALFLASFFIWGISAHIIFVHQIAFFVDVGYTAMFAASIAVLLGVISLAGTVGGFLSDRIGREVTFSFASSGIILAVFLLIIIKDTSYPWLVYLYAVAFGLGVGGIGSLLTAATADLFQGKNFGFISGLVGMGYAVGGTLGSWLAGYIFDVTHSYTPAFVIVILAACLAIACIWIASPRKMRPIRGNSSG